MNNYKCEPFYRIASHPSFQTQQMYFLSLGKLFFIDLKKFKVIFSNYILFSFMFSTCISYLFCINFIYLIFCIGVYRLLLEYYI